MKIVIPGGSGQGGRVLARHFHACGDAVTVFSRGPRPAAWRVVKWDAVSRGDWIHELAQSDVCINLSGRSVNCRYTDANRREITESRVGTTRLLHEGIASLKNPPCLWLNASTATITNHGSGRNHIAVDGGERRRCAVTLEGLHAVTLSEADPLVAAHLLTDILGLMVLSEEGNRTRVAMPENGFIDLLRAEPNRGSAGSGVIHHVALRCGVPDELETWRAKVIEAGMRSTIVIDRRYFQSIYFRERDANNVGGVLFEIATDVPGFAVDEPVEHLGESLMLPPWLESSRESIERRLPKLS